MPYLEGLFFQYNNNKADAVLKLQQYPTHLTDAVSLTEMPVNLGEQTLHGTL